MSSTISSAEVQNDWDGGGKPLKASYGKLMMWFFIVSDALTFSGFLVSYGFARFKHIDSWPIADEVFTHFPFLHGVDAPMYYVALMTFILIFSSVTMVLAVDAGHSNNKNKVAFYMLLTIVGGAVFVGSQAWEWANFIRGEYGALETKGGQIIQFVDSENSNKRIALKDFVVANPKFREQHQSSKGLWYRDESSLPTFTLDEVSQAFFSNPNLLVRSEKINEKGKKIILSREESIEKVSQAVYVVEGANLIRNEYGNRLFADFFFFITGFHGFHVFSGVVINFIIFLNVILGTYEKRGHYEMVEKVGLYWHFVDLVWVFVFTFFYLV
ncbi:MAG: cytochrome c oxidase subunit 3 [Bacteroidota bacterium]|nr:cytochrome c oxidase subunit 3 [Bacteroidota bacterium]MEC8175524.1 cytochrome c oxidase subunit 3 [Bacteroidota bacterium]MEC8367544.1 cytochrome c oxidase subunit 3 [Bacteroidota bacterium]MEC8602005.1 cytochrome c oxidase subunit 3 [Bacteroidota bacterium]|tara:strand:+ start:409 stop:1389 length:981 start_codon:yes stop_codon:yes gene_type:complete